MPEGLLMYAKPIGDLLRKYTGVRVVVLGETVEL
jgi:diphthamide synthase subunit DPH2